ncbi:MAG: hypothetical protein ACXW1T_12610 [Methylophilus sp.]
MIKPTLAVIDGSRDQIEHDLVEALFGTDEIEITRLVDLLNRICDKTPQLKLLNPFPTSHTT